MFKTTLKIEKVHQTSTEWVLLDELIYVVPMGRKIVVPSGFKTDLVTNWVRGRHDEAAVIHDYLLSKGESWRYSNKVMNLAMKDSKVHPLHRILIKAFIDLNGLRHAIFGK